jgi:hypothetical protein
MRIIPGMAPIRPLDTKAQILESVRQQVPRAHGHALWVFPLDCFQNQSPVSGKIEGADGDMYRNYEAMGRFAVELTDTQSAVEVVLVWEQPTGAEVKPADRARARALERELDTAYRVVRAQVLAHSTGLSWISGDD